MMTCPQCGSTWPEGNFCPHDGAKLVPVEERLHPAIDVATESGEGPATVVMEAAMLPGEHPSKGPPQAEQLATRLETPALQIDASPLKNPAKRRRPVRDADMNETVVEFQALDDEAVRRARQQVVTATDHPPEQQRPRVAPKARDIGSKSMSDDKTTEAQKKPTEQDAKAADSKGAKRNAKDQGFSETQWFMTGAMTDADLLEMVEQSSYDRDEKITESERKGFTLRETDDKKGDA